MTLTEWSNNQNKSSTTLVQIDELLRGIGSKQITLNYTGNGNAISVDSNAQAPNKYWNQCSTIENLVIDGQNPTNNTGIFLNDVYNCRIRNLTIRNFNVGIKITADNGNWSEVNAMTHIRMENVNTGILLDSGTGTGSFAFTTIDDVGIQLSNSIAAVGIQIGTANNSIKAQPYSAFIKANVWEQSAEQAGMKLINGEVKYGLINLAVQGPSNGFGVDLSNSAGKSVYYNQFSTFNSNDEVIDKGFLLYCGGISNPIKPAQSTPANDIRVVPLP